MDSPVTPARFEIDLSAGGIGQEALIFGWASQEDRYTWALGPRSTLCLVPPNDTCLKSDYALRLIGFPSVRPNIGSFQRLVVAVNGHKLASLLIRSKFDTEVFVGAALMEGSSQVSIEFEFPDAHIPMSFDPLSTDQRNLGIAFSRITLHSVSTEKAHEWSASVSDRDVLMDLQSLGVNCELGFVQRAVTAEPYGLFRWNSITLPNLINALDHRFEGLGTAENTEVVVDGASEIMIVDKRYHFRNHSHAFENKGAKVDAIYKRELVRIPQLARMLIENLEDGSRLFVFHDAGGSPLAEVKRLVDALRKYGDNTLLWVTTAGDSKKIGKVEPLAPNLMVGYIDRFQPLREVTPEGVSLPTWLSIAREAHLIWRPKRT